MEARERREQRGARPDAARCPRCGRRRWTSQPGSGRPSVAVVRAQPSSIDCCQSANRPSKPRTSSSTTAAAPTPKTRASAAASKRTSSPKSSRASRHGATAAPKTARAPTPGVLLQILGPALRGGERPVGVLREADRCPGGVVHLDSCIGRRNYPSMPVDHAAAPRNSKIPDRVKLSRCEPGGRPGAGRGSGRGVSGRSG